MRSSLAISVFMHAILLGALFVQWHAVTVAHRTGYVYSIKLLGPAGGGGSGGAGPERHGHMRVTMPREAPTPRVARTEEATVPVPKRETSAPAPESETVTQDIDVGTPEGELPYGGGGGGGGGGSGGGWGTGVGRGVGPGRGSGNGTVEPKPLFIPWPKYPSGVRTIPSGRVELSLFVNDRGEVEDVKVTQGLPIEELNAIALQTARKIRFTPGLVNGVRTPMWVRLAIGFQPR